MTTITDELIAHVAGEPHTRQQRFALHRAIYEGEMDAPLVKDDGAPNLLDSIIVPALRKIINAHARMLFGTAPTFDVTEAYGEDAQAYLQRLWRENHAPIRLLELAKNGGTTGAFGFKFEPDTSAPEREGQHRLVVFDPSYLDVVWDPHDVSKVLLYRFEYPTVADDGTGTLEPFVWRQDIKAEQSEPDEYGNTRIVGWTITNWRAQMPKHAGGVGRWIGFTATRQISKWEQQGGEHKWPFEWAPVFAGQNQIAPNSWWGYSDIEQPIRRLNDALNRAASNIAKTIRHHGHPTTIVVGATLPEDHAIGEPIEIPADNPADVQVFNLEMESNLQAALEFLREVRAEVYDAGDVPDVARGKVDNIGQLSGIALQILFGPMLQLNGEKRELYGAAIVAWLRAALAYAKFEPLNGADGTVELVWPPALPKNEKEEAETGDIDRRNGLSQRTYLERRGYDADVEKENGLEEGATDPGMRGVLDLVGAPQEPAQRVEDADSATDASVSDE